MEEGDGLSLFAVKKLETWTWICQQSQSGFLQMEASINISKPGGCNTSHIQQYMDFLLAL